MCNYSHVATCSLYVLHTPYTHDSVINYYLPRLFGAAATDHSTLGVPHLIITMYVWFGSPPSNFCPHPRHSTNTLVLTGGTTHTSRRRRRRRLSNPPATPNQTKPTLATVVPNDCPYPYLPPGHVQPECFVGPPCWAGMCATPFSLSLLLSASPFLFTTTTTTHSQRLQHRQQDRKKFLLRNRYEAFC